MAHAFVRCLFVASLFIVSTAKATNVFPSRDGLLLDLSPSILVCHTARCWNNVLRGGDSEQELTEGSDTIIHSDHLNDVIQMEGILIPRSLSLLRMIRVVLLSVAMHFLFECWSTSGQPYRQALQDLGFILSDTNEQKSKISSMVKLMAKYIAEGSDGKVELPPTNFPSFFSFIGLIMAFSLLALSLLLPMWNTRLEVWANYERLVDTKDKKKKPEKNDKWHLEQLLLDHHRYDTVHQNPVAVLAKVFPNVTTRKSSESSENIARPTFIILPLLTVLTESIAAPMEQSDSERNHTEDKKLLHDHPQSWYVEYQHQRIYVNPNTLQSFYGGPTFYETIPLHLLVKAASPSSLKLSKERYGPYNHITLTHPTIGSTLRKRFTSSPLVMIQFASSLFYALEDEVHHAALNFLHKFVWYYINARRLVLQSKQLAKDIEMQEDSLGNVVVKALRCKRGASKTSKWGWVDVPIKDVFPGDIFCFPIPSLHSQLQIDFGNATSLVTITNMPIDALLLEGTVVCNEAVLTGESVPQYKVPIIPKNGLHANATDTLDMFGRHRSSILFAGTTIVHACKDDRSIVGKLNGTKTPQGYVSCLALRTGAYSSRGEIIRALHEHPTALGSDPMMELDGLKSLAVLSIFAVAMCASLMFNLERLHLIPAISSASLSDKYKYTSTVEMKRLALFRKIITCTRIAMASIPTNLPLVFSGVVSSCAEQLKKMDDVVCSTPMALLDASRVDLVVFDKTGTLTADTQQMTEVIQYSDMPMHPSIIDIILGGCHSLVSLPRPTSEDKQKNPLSYYIAGDPLDIAALRFSGWAFNGKEQMACCRNVSIGPTIKPNCLADKETSFPSGSFRPIKLWQLCSFPFSPHRRMSSAVVLVLHENGAIRVYRVIKGATDVMKQFFRLADSNNLLPFHEWYDEQCQSLGIEGKRIVATGFADVTSKFESWLLPKGLPKLSLDSHMHFTISRKAILKARRRAKEYLDQEAVEDAMSASLIFSGFACFIASIRDSSARVVNDLKNNGIDVCMLTGDGIDAAVSVAIKTGVIEKLQAKKGICVIDSIEGVLRRKIIKPLSSKKTQMRSKTSSTWINLTSFEKNVKRCGTIVATGSAVETLISKCEENKEMKNYLNHLSVIACASPKAKQKVIQAFKHHCRRHVMMCGDGVNDVGAMHSADVGIALLGGYGEEQQGIACQGSVDDQIRRERFRLTKVGKKHTKESIKTIDDKLLVEAGIGTSPEASLTRIKMQIDKSLRDSPKRHQGLRCVTLYFKCLSDEIKRANMLKQGGGNSAQILAEEDRKRKSILSNTFSDTDLSLMRKEEMGEDSKDTMLIKPGEASISADFTILRASIVGVEATIRSGIAAAARCLHAHQVIFLECVIACHTLAILYEANTRYSKLMWPVELFVYQMIEKLSQEPTQSPRPTLTHASIRPASSIFHLSSFISILLQGVIHVSTLNIGVHEAKQFDQRGALKNAALRIRLGHKNNGTRNTDLSAVSLFLKILSSSSTMPDASFCTPPPAHEESVKKDNRSTSFLGQRSFQPNSVSNVVFLFSIFRSVVIVLVNHRGFPFYMSISECPDLSAMICKSITFIVMCICETIPLFVQGKLGLISWPEKRIKVSMLLLLMANIVGCFVVDDLCTFIWHHELWKVQHDTASRRDNGELTSVAEYEEEILHKEKKKTKKIVLLCVIFIAGTVATGFMTDNEKDKSKGAAVDWLPLFLLLRL